MKNPTVVLLMFGIIGVGCGYRIPGVEQGLYEVSIRADGKKSSGELDHSWEYIAGSGHAGLYVRPVWKERMLAHLADVHDNLGIERVRFHGIFIDEVGVYQGPGDYDFTNVDLIFDSILAAGVKPFIELSFMPEELASCRKHGFPIGYRPFICPPEDYAEWGAMIEAFTRHLLERYGLDEVRDWHFEVWNEPNLPMFWGGSKEEYLRLYDVTATSIKSVDRQLKVGGPSTSAAVSPMIVDLIGHCNDNGVPLDFITTHGYSNERIAPIAKEAERAGVVPIIDPDQGFFYNEVRLLGQIIDRSSDRPLPLYITEWNSSVAYSYQINFWPNDHDLPNDAAFMCEGVAQANGYTDGFSHWTYSDVFEEWGLPGEKWPIKKGAFHGGFGLITYDHIHKPSYHAFSFLHQMGDKLLDVHVEGSNGDVDAMITLDESGLKIIAWYYLDTIKGRQYSGPAASVQLSIKDLPREMEGKEIRGYRIDRDHGNPFSGWLEMGKPGELTPMQVETLKKLSDETLRDERLQGVIENGGLEMSFELPPAGVVFLSGG